MLSAFRFLSFSIKTMLFILLLASCTSVKQLQYFQDLPDNNIVDLPPFQPEERIIENGDDLYIYFSAKDNEAANYFNKSYSGAAATTAIGIASAAINSSGYSYIVGNDGYLDIPNLGAIKVTGLNAPQLRAKLVSSVAPYLKNPMAEVRFNTFKISVIGEVRSPGRYVLDMQRTSILDALAAAGDLPATAKRYDIRLYRDYNGQRKIYKIDLTKSSIFNNPDLFQMRHNDVLYVQPLKSGLFRENFGTAAGVFSILLSVVTLGFTLLKN